MRPNHRNDRSNPRTQVRRRLAAAATLALGFASVPVHVQAQQLISGGASVFTTSETDSFNYFNTSSLKFVTSAANTPLTLTLKAVTSGPVLNVSSGLVTVNGGQVAVINGGTLECSNSSSPALTFNVNAGSALIMNSALANSIPGLTLPVVMNSNTGTGILVLNNSSPTLNTFSGGILLNSGTIQISSPLNLGVGGNFVTFNGGTLETTASVTFSAGQALSFQSSSGALSVDGGVVTTLANANQLLSTGGNFNKSGAGTLILAASNTFSTNTLVNSGTIQLQDLNALGTTTKSNITLNTGSQLNLRYDSFSLDSNGNESAGFGNNISVTGASATVDVGYLASFDTSGNLQLGTLNLSSGSTLNVTNTTGSSRTLEFTGNISLGAGSGFNTSTGLFLSGAISGAGGLNITGPAGVTIYGSTANTYTGGTTVSGGTLTLGKNVSGGKTAVPGNLTVSGGTVLTLYPNQFAGNFSSVLITAGALELNNTNQSVYSLNNSGGTLTTGTGTLTITSQDTAVFSAGVTTINSGGSLVTPHLIVQGGVNTVQSNGLIQVGSVGLFFNSVAPPMNQNQVNPALTLTSDPAIPGRLLLQGPLNYTCGVGSTGVGMIGNTGAIPMAGTLDLNGSVQSFTIGAGPSGTDMVIAATVTDGGIDKEGTGMLQLAASNSYSGGTTLGNGTLQVTDPAALGSGSVTFTGGILDLATDASSLSVGNSLYAGGANPLAVTADRITPSTPGAFSVQVGSVTVGSTLNVAGNTNGTVVMGAMTLVNNLIIGNSIGLTINGVIGGANGFTKNLSGLLTLGGTGSNTYFGTTSVYTGTLLLDKSSAIAVPGALLISSGGTVMLGASAQIASNAYVTFNSQTTPGTLNLNNFSQTIGSLVDQGVSSSIQLGSSGTGILAFGGNGDSQSFNGVVSGNGLLVKNAGGTYSFTGINTYTGGATVNGGTLVFTHAPSQVVGATLSGGAWTVLTSSTLTLQGVGSLTTIGPLTTVALNGSNSSFVALSSVAANLGSLTVTGGRTFAAVSNFTNDGTLSIGSGSSSMSFAGGLSNAIGSQGSSGTTVVSSGGYLLADDIRQSNLAIAGTAAINASGSAVSIVQNLNMMVGGTLDLANGDLIARNSTLTSITSAIVSGYNGGSWAGTGIASSTAHGDTTHLTALGVISNNNGSGGAIYSTFEGAPALVTDVLVKYTYYGDANLDGRVDGSDYSRIDAAFLADSGNPTAATGWYNGDFNYDGVVNGSDYTLLDNAYNGQNAAIAADVASLPADESAGAVSVPEPQTIPMLALAWLVLLSGRTVALIRQPSGHLYRPATYSS